MASSDFRLCIFCRKLEPASTPCPKQKSRDSAKESDHFGPEEQFNQLCPLSAHDEKLLKQLQDKPSSLCKRCADYNPLKVFELSEPLPSGLIPEDSDKFRDYFVRLKPYELDLGELGSLTLQASCPFCRLVYRIMPTEAIRPDTKGMRLTPYPAYVRHAGWQYLAEETRTKSAIFLGLRHLSHMIHDLQVPLLFSDNEPGVQSSEMTGPAICLATEDTCHDRKQYNGRLIEPFVDFGFARNGLDVCWKNHKEYCISTKPKELFTTKMIDVLERKVVPYPEGCEYVALSYTWGGIMPEEGALEKKTLPQTIEDSITVTKKLGKRYLWVDALCINQKPWDTLSVQEKAEKTQQLAMMDLIYQCATVTLVALSGQNSNAGLCGVSRKREMQLHEIINGRTLFTIPAVVEDEMAASAWDTRAWTFQEGMLSKRSLFFSDKQLGISCQRFGAPDAYDPSCYEHLSDRPMDFFRQLMNGFNLTDTDISVTDPQRILLYTGLIIDYTSRQMSWPSDSLNACLGLLSALQRHLFPSGFEWGLPLRQFPLTLGWSHDWSFPKPERLHKDSPPWDIARPQRREGFPSWSWCGWEGHVTFDQTSLLDGSLVTAGKGRRGRDVKSDMVPEFVGCEGKKLTINGYVCNFYIRTEPFSEAFLKKPENEDEQPFGIVSERNFPHPYTLKTGEYECLVVERLRHTQDEEFVKDTVYMIVLDWVISQDGRGEVAERRTFVTVQSDVEFEKVKPVRRVVHLE
ncbi:heterokaryon incompatibility protein-domain-containing protein [Neurospora hispaniola]|uniref:Heterokaryon incompatibility protein-domain-containing protein n=1 Tax=Neurospora hispaniola TaxID=588809 RepID=A0AAJ0MW37_9PEZI|nr:heterokaryon incompatibility protein-domain-containing protein [Neurospora hispaniola]